MNIIDIIKLLQCNTCIVLKRDFATGETSYTLETYHNKHLSDFPDNITISSLQFKFLYSLDFIIDDSYMITDNSTLYIWFEYNPVPVTYKPH